MKEGDTPKVVKAVKDYVSIVQERFPGVPKKDIERIMNYGFKSLYLHESYKGDILLKSSKLNNFFFLLGNLTFNSSRHFRYYIKKVITKIRVIFNKSKAQYNGYYYFALTEKQYKDRILDRQSPLGKKKRKFNYGPIILYKIEKECLVREFNKPYIFRIPVITDLGYRVFKRDLITTKAEFLYKRETKGFKNVSVKDYREFKKEILKNNKYLCK